MPNCMICKKSVVSGYVLCSHCAESLEPRSLSPELAVVLDRLAEDITLNREIPACLMCENHECSPQVSGLVCRSGVKKWLTSKAEEYLSAFSAGRSA